MSVKDVQSVERRETAVAVAACSCRCSIRVHVRARVKGEVTSGVHPTSATSAAPSRRATPRRAAHIIPLLLLCVLYTGHFISARYRTAESILPSSVKCIDNIIPTVNCANFRNELKFNGWVEKELRSNSPLRLSSDGKPLDKSNSLLNIDNIERCILTSF